MPSYLIFGTNRGSSSVTECLRLDSNGNVLLGFNGTTGVQATTATDGFAMFTTCAGTPTGVATSYTGMVPMIVDTTASKIWFRIGGTWKGVAVT